MKNRPSVKRIGYSAYLANFFGFIFLASGDLKYFLNSSFVLSSQTS